VADVCQGLATGWSVPLTTTTRQRLLIIGSGGHGRSVAEAALAGEIYDLIGFIDDCAGHLQTVMGFPVLGHLTNLGQYRHMAAGAIVAIGQNALRERLHHEATHAGFNMVAVVHPKAIVSPSAVIGAGCAIMAGAVIGTQAKLACGVIVNSGAVVDHDAHVHAFGHLGVNAGMAGQSVVGHGAWLQAGSVLNFGEKLQAGGVMRRTDLLGA
jgi:sugar O-acyltransferase (sialic acid O-acetyltransferase NeuD family)